MRRGEVYYLLLGNTELVEAQGSGEGLLGEGLFGQYRSSSLRSFVSLWGIEQDELLDLSQFIQQLFHGQSRPGTLSFLVDEFEQRDPQHTIEGMNPDLAVGPMIHGSPAQPVPIFQAAEYLLNLLLTRIRCHHLLSGPVGSIR